MKGNQGLDKFQNIGMVGTLIALTGIAGLTFFMLNSRKETEVIETKVANHDLYFYKQDGTISLFNTKDKKYLDEYKLSEKTQIEQVEHHINLFDISEENNTVYASSPYSKEIVTFIKEDKKMKELKRLKVEDTIENFKVVEDKIIIQYLNNNNLDIYDLNNGAKTKTITLKDDVTSIEVDNSFIYVGTGDYIEIIPLQNTKSNENVRIHTGAKTTSILKSTDGFLYVANTFATDVGKSVLVKINLEKNHVEDILELGKEYPISMFEKEDNLYILCQGLIDGSLDGISIINKTNFEVLRNISTGDGPNSMIYTEDNYIYVTHEDGTVVTINAANQFNQDSTFVINGVKNLILE